MGAFDWSPGGCCCDVATWWYDLYQFDSRSPKHLVRTSCASKNDQPSDSFDGDQWFVTPSTTTTPTPKTFQLYGYGSTNEQVWSVEQRSGSYWAVLYDCVAKSEISVTATASFVENTTPFPRIYSQFTSHYADSTGRFPPGIYNSVSANQSTLAIISGSPGNSINDAPPFVEIISGGSSTSPVAVFPAINNGVFFSLGIFWNATDIPNIVAPRSWPRVAGVTTRSYSAIANGQQSATLTYTTIFTVGDLTIESAGPTKQFHIRNAIWTLDLTFTIQVLISDSGGLPSSSRPRWMYFDANGDKWIGVIQWETFSRQTPVNGFAWKQTSHIALVINGTIIKQYDDCAAFLDGSDTTSPNGPWSSVHAMFNGYLAVVALEYAIEPGASFPFGQLQQPRHTRLRIYNGPSLVWESPLATGAVTCHSSDRWLYAELDGMDFHDMPPCAFTSDISRVGHTLNVRNHWLIRPDGTACSPMGVRESEGTTVLPPELDTGFFAQHNPMYSPRLGFETIKHSDLMPDVPPVEPF